MTAGARSPTPKPVAPIHRRRGKTRDGRKWRSRGAVKDSDEGEEAEHPEEDMSPKSKFFAEENERRKEAAKVQIEKDKLLTELMRAQLKKYQGECG